MNLSGNTIFITGGTSGIGMALAERFLALDNEVIICGRRKEALDEMKKKNPKLHTRVCDTGKAEDRVEIASNLVQEFPRLNVVINNAGIQRKVDLIRVNLADREEWKDTKEEIAVNLEGPIHLGNLFLPHLAKQPKAAIMNVTSGLAFVPLATVPIYCATKAALHSYTQSLRYQLTGSNVEVIEIAPPAVRTNLGGSHDFGTPLAEFADAVMEQLSEGSQLVSYEFSTHSSRIGQHEFSQVFDRMNPPKN